MSVPSEPGRVTASPSPVKRRLAVVSFVAALYPPAVIVVEGALSPLVQQQGCPRLHALSGVGVHLCGIQNLSPLVGVFTVANYSIVVAILAALVSGHVALYHHRRAALATSRRNLAIVGLVLGYVWGAIATYILLLLLGVFGALE